MRFGLRLLPRPGNLRELIALAGLAEEVGFDQVWVAGDLFMPDAQAVAVSIALNTSRVGIGATCDPFRTDPSSLAAFGATLDLLSNGRALLATGMHSAGTVSWTGGDPEHVAQRLEESVALVRTLLRGEVARSDTDQFRWTSQCHLHFRPLRSDIPIYVVPFDRTLQLSGRIGDGSLPALYPPESAGYMTEVIRAGAVAAGRDPRTVDVAGCIWVCLDGADDGPARRSLRSSVGYYGRFLSEHDLGLIGLSRKDFEPLGELHDAGREDEAIGGVTEQMMRLALIGSADQVGNGIDRLADAGLTQINVGGPLGDDPSEAIRTFGREIIPQFRSR